MKHTRTHTKNEQYFRTESVTVSMRLCKSVQIIGSFWLLFCRLRRRRRGRCQQTCFLYYHNVCTSLFVYAFSFFSV